MKIISFWLMLITMAELDLEWLVSEWRFRDFLNIFLNVYLQKRHGYQAVGCLVIVKPSRWINPANVRQIILVWLRDSAWLGLCQFYVLHLWKRLLSCFTSTFVPKSTGRDKDVLLFRFPWDVKCKILIICELPFVKQSSWSIVCCPSWFHRCILEAHRRA